MKNTKQKIAVLSDIHSNLTALEAVIADLRQEQATEVWLLGDLLMFGHGADDLLALLAELPVTVSIRGNWDDIFLDIFDKKLPLEDPSDIYVTKLGQFLSENISPENVEYIRNLPLTAKREIKGLKFSFSHNLPDQNGGHALLPSAPQDNFDKLFIHENSDVALYGHVHHQMMRYSSKEQLIINPGSVGQPFSWWTAIRQDRRAQYALLTLDSQGLADVQLKKVNYDIDKEIARAAEKGLPYLDLYEEVIRLGFAHTHDEELLRDYNQKTNYEQEARDFMNNK